MSDFINTIDALGDDAVSDSLFERTITEFADNTLTFIADHGFRSCELLEIINLPNVTELGSNTFNNCKSLHEVTLPSIEVIMHSKDVLG